MPARKSGASQRKRRSKSSPPSVQDTPTSPSTTKPCKDCGSVSRARPYPGPRCATCHRERRKGLSEARRLTYVAKQYGLTPAQYQALVDACRKNDKGQPVCYICDRNRGNCVDHDHACCPGKVSCGKCVRGLICNPCNKGVLGHLRDSVPSLIRSINYLMNPPAHKILKELKEQENE